jgi:hypothetical protein
VNAIQERRRENRRNVAYLRQCEPELLDFEPPVAPRRTFPTMLVVTLAVVVLISTASAILLALNV